MFHFAPPVCLCQPVDNFRFSFGIGMLQLNKITENYVNKKTKTNTGLYYKIHQEK